MAAELNNLISELETTYQQLMTKDNSPDEELNMKMAILKSLSSIKAFAEARGTLSADVSTLMEQLKNELINWDPFGPWFKEVKTLVDSVHKVITAGKKIKFQESAPGVHGVLPGAAFSAFKSQVERDIAQLRKEVEGIKTVLKSVVKGEVPTKASPVPTPVPVQAPKPTPVAPQPVPVPVPTAAPTPAPVPKVVSEAPVHVKPIALDEKPMVTIPAASSRAKSPREVLKEKGAKLHGIFSAEPTPGPAPPLSSGGGSPTPTPVPIPGVTSQPAREAPAPQPVPIPGTSPAAAAPVSIDTSDPEKLYQELVSLEGRRFALEAGIRQLKEKFEAGQGMSEAEYKKQLQEKLEKLKEISATIEVIREKLD